jgi:hypothetical protein
MSYKMSSSCIKISNYQVNCNIIRIYKTFYFTVMDIKRLSRIFLHFLATHFINKLYILHQPCTTTKSDKCEQYFAGKTFDKRKCEMLALSRTLLDDCI